MTDNPCAHRRGTAHPADSNTSDCVVEMSTVEKSQDTAWKDVLDTKGLSAAGPILRSQENGVGAGRAGGRRLGGGVGRVDGRARALWVKFLFQ